MSGGSAFDAVIRGGEVVTSGGVHSLDVGVAAGRIIALAAPDSLDGASIIDAAGKTVLPGAIDIHFHVRAPAYPDRGTVASETQAAAAGGVTTIFEMPISKPCCATPDVFLARRSLFAEHAYVNFALYGAPGTLDRDDIFGMKEAGAIGFKIFMTEAPKGRDDEFVGLCITDEGPLLEALMLTAETGLVTSVHAESSQLLDYFSSKLLATGRNDAATHGESRPPVVEAVAIAKLCAMNALAGAKLHIAHVSSCAALDVVRRFQGDMDLTAETCPQYLLFTEAALVEHGSYAKINPPLRTSHDQEALWDALADGTLMAVTTDHSPFAASEKEKAKTDIWAAPPGAPGVEELVLSMLDAVHKGRVSLEQAVNLISTNGAKRFGLYPRKGVIMPGADADLIIVDLDAQTTIDKSKLLTKARLCDQLYDGMTFHARIETTLLGGKVIFHQGAILGASGDGRFVTPQRVLRSTHTEVPA